ncbi:MAG: hypothetical protein CMP98_15825 [Gammaproteobacteria bacterium]|nr:hypothetical protein [Gammaproteobacteria bacterium]
MSEPWDQEKKDTAKEQRHDHAPLHMRAIVVGGVLLGAVMVTVKGAAIKTKNLLGRVKTRMGAVE